MKSPNIAGQQLRNGELAGERNFKGASEKHGTKSNDYRESRGGTAHTARRGLVLLDRRILNHQFDFVLTGTKYQFIVGLGITDLFNGFGSSMGSSGKGIAIVLDVVAAGIFTLFGFFGRKGHLWSFIIGIGLYVIDALLLLLFKQYLAIALHAYVIYRIYNGLQACQRLKFLTNQEAQQGRLGASGPDNSDVWPPPPRF